MPRVLIYAWVRRANGHPTGFLKEAGLMIKK